MGALRSAESNTAVCVNNLSHSVFSSLSVSLNSKLFTRLSLQGLPLKLLIYGSDASGLHLASSLWYLDSPQELKDNNGYTTLLKYIGNSQTLEMYGRLHANFFNSHQIFINNVDMNIKLTRIPEAFSLLAPTNDTKVRIKILAACALCKWTSFRTTYNELQFTLWSYKSLRNIIFQYWYSSR